MAFGTNSAIRQLAPTGTLRVLWFGTSPSLGRRFFDSSFTVGTSWIEALELLIHQAPGIMLGLAFPWPTDRHQHFTCQETSTQYYAMPRRPHNKWQRLFQRIFFVNHDKEIVSDALSVVERFKPDLVAFFGTETPYPLIIPHLKVPHVVWFQGNLTVYQQKWHAGISIWQSIKAERLYALMTGNSDIQQYWQYDRYVRREHEIFTHIHNFIGRTQWDRRLAQTMAPQAQYHHCDEALRPIFHQLKWQPHDRVAKVVVSTFRENLFKGLETAMAAFQMLTSTLGWDITWRVIGVDASSTYAKVSKSNSGLTDSSGFQLLGAKKAEDLAKELLNADLFVHPSHIDNSPNSLCEAMLMGIPVVSTNVGGIPSMLSDGEEGLLVQNGDAYALAGAIHQLLSDKKLAATLGSAARKRALMRHDGEHILTDLVSIYRKISGRTIPADPVVAIEGASGKTTF